ncbi:MAG: nucleotidyltransferase family protein [Synergistes sp.]|nr:nucleotidyltransferase family protein [Synergistes sp.]
MEIEVILLAAGLSKRMGRQKLLLPFGGSTVIETVVSNLRAAGFGKINAVLSREVEASVRLPDGVLIRINEAPERGQSSSLAIGLDMLEEGSDFAIMLGDLPLVRPADITALAEKFSSLPSCRTVLAPCREGVFGHPMFYRAVWKNRFTEAQGDTGGKAVLMRRACEIERIEASAVHFRDMDTPDEYKSLLADS